MANIRILYGQLLGLLAEKTKNWYYIYDYSISLYYQHYSRDRRKCAEDARQ